MSAQREKAYVAGVTFATGTVALQSRLQMSPQREKALGR
jgi:hypothetical protein